MSNINENIVGARIGIFDVLYECNFKTNYGHKMYHVKCSECGWESNMRKYDIKITKKCTHIKINGSYRDFNKYKWANKRINKIFNGMIQRCYNENDKAYRWYGAKGIKICDEWIENPNLFEEWALNNGYTDKLTIDRIEENENYAPDNCRWIPNKDNAKYKSTTSLIEVDGEIHTGKDWSRKLGFGINVINKYIRRYGLDNTIEFIRRYKANPNLRPFKHNKSIYSLYMN